MRVRLLVLAAALLVVPVEPTAGGVCIYLTGGPAAAWSPDGNWIALSLVAGERCGGHQLALLPARGGEPVTVPLPQSPSGFPESLSWAPDSSRLVVAYNDRRLVVHSVAGGSEQPIPPGSSPAWAPDGSAIAYVAGGQVYRIAPDGTGRQAIARGGTPTWSPDARSLAYERDGRVYIAAPDGADERFVAAGAAPLWSPDGSRLALRRSDGATATVPIGGGNEIEVGRGAPVAWAPAGDQLVLRDSIGAVRVVSVNGEARRVAEDVVAVAVDPRWEVLATVLRAGWGSEVYLADVSGARPRKITGRWNCRLYPRRCSEGTDRADRLVGTDERDVFFPGGGDDRVWSRSGHDRVDTAYGRDYVNSGPGNDVVRTQGNDDVIFAGRGIDNVTPGNGEDFVDAGPGPDWVTAAGDGRVDRVRCGPGPDAMTADWIDWVASDCEKVMRF
jgi:hypothetical protein